MKSNKNLQGSFKGRTRRRHPKNINDLRLYVNPKFPEELQYACSGLRNTSPNINNRTRLWNEELNFEINISEYV